MGMIGMMRIIIRIEMTKTIGILGGIEDSNDRDEKDDYDDEGWRNQNSNIYSKYYPSGPPESPLHVPFPPVVSIQTTPSPTIPYTSLHSLLVMIGRSLTILKTGLIPPAAS